MEENAHEPLISLQVDYDAGNSLKETARWTKFISILGFICVALVLLALVFAGSIITSLYARLLPGVDAFAGILMFLIVLVVAIFGFMVFLLYRFSTLVRKGIETHDQASFNRGLGALKLYFIFTGVFAILSLISNFSNFFRY